MPPAPIRAMTRYGPTFAGSPGSRSVITGAALTPDFAGQGGSSRDNHGSEAASVHSPTVGAHGTVRSAVHTKPHLSNRRKVSWMVQGGVLTLVRSKGPLGHDGWAAVQSAVRDPVEAEYCMEGHAGVRPHKRPLLSVLLVLPCDRWLAQCLYDGSGFKEFARRCHWV